MYITQEVRIPLALLRKGARTGVSSLNVLLEALLRWGRRSVRLRQRHDAVRALQVRLEGLLIGGLQGMEEMLRLPNVVTVKSPVAPEGEEPEAATVKGHRKEKKKMWKRNLLSGDESGLRVGIVDAFSDGFCQNSHVSGIVREHGQQHRNNYD